MSTTAANRAAIRAAAVALRHADLDHLVHTLLDAMDRDDLAEIHTAEEIDAGEVLRAEIVTLATEQRTN